MLDKTYSFVNLFRNDDKGGAWRATFMYGDISVDANTMPAINTTLFTRRVSPKGTKFLRSTKPLVVEFNGARPGNKPGLFFTDILSLTELKPNKAELDAMLDA